MSESASSLRIMVVDDHPVFRMGLIALLSSIEGLEVVAQADSVASAIEAAEHNEIDVVMMDLNLGDESGVEATREIVARRPDVRVVGLSMHQADDMARSMLDAGASAYVTKNCRPDELIDAIRDVGRREAS